MNVNRKLSEYQFEYTKLTPSFFLVEKKCVLSKQGVLGSLLRRFVGFVYTIAFCSTTSKYQKRKCVFEMASYCEIYNSDQGTFSCSRDVVDSGLFPGRISHLGNMFNILMPTL